MVAKDDAYNGFGEVAGFWMGLHGGTTPRYLVLPKEGAISKSGEIGTTPSGQRHPKCSDLSIRFVCDRKE